MSLPGAFCKIGVSNLTAYETQSHCPIFLKKNDVCFIISRRECLEKEKFMMKSVETVFDLILSDGKLVTFFCYYNDLIDKIFESK